MNLRNKFSPKNFEKSHYSKFDYREYNSEFTSKSLSNSDLNSNQKINWKIISSVVSILLLIVASITYKELTVKRILHLRADDVSESGREHQNAQTEHCKVSQRQQKAGDYSVIIPFAEKAEVFNERKIENQLDFVSCEFDTSTFGKLPGTSVVNLFRLAQTVVTGYRARGVDLPLVFSITLDAAEPLPGKPYFNQKSLQEVVDISNELTSNGQIVIIGPSQIENLQYNLKQSLETNPNIKICPYENVKACTEEAIHNARL